MVFKDDALDAFGEFLDTVKALRHPETGCPWDLKQDFRSLRKYMLEEAYEACEALASGDRGMIVEELGDVLLQVVLNSQLGQDAGLFDISQVIRVINEKMVRRHPHVFRPSDKKLNDQDVRTQWQKIKEREKGASLMRDSLFSEIKAIGPSSHTAVKIGKRAKEIGFDWNKLSEVLCQFESEVVELKEALGEKPVDPKEVEDELGDVFFTLAQVCRFLGVDPEVAAANGNVKFLRRFEVVEEAAASAGRRFGDLQRDEKEAFWRKAKSIQKNQKS